MDSTPASASQNSSQTTRPGAPETSNNLKQSPQANPEPHQRNPQGTYHQGSPGTPQPGPASIGLQKYDQKARIWIFIYVCWLVWNIYASLPESLQLEQLGSNFIVLVFVAAPYYIQLWGIYKRSLEATNLGIKILCVYGFFVAILFLITVVVHFYFAELFGFAEKLLEKSPDSAEEMELMDLPDRDKTKEGIQTSIKDFAISFAYFVVGYFAARKYRNYLNQREKLIKKKD